MIKTIKQILKEDEENYPNEEIPHWVYMGNIGLR